MSKIKSFSVGDGDMFYINHGNDNFSIIDCHLSEDNKEDIIKNIKDNLLNKRVVRFISTHPDQDHIQGLKYLDENINILNFYCIKNKVVKEEETDDFKHYCKLRDSDKSFYIEKGCSRRWMNCSSDERGSAGINIIWPDINNEHFKDSLDIAENRGSPNNTSTIIKYSLENGVTALWMGDLETEFMEKIENDIDWFAVDVLFAPHHGRKSGKVPKNILNQIDPKLIVLGEADAEDLCYYPGYNTISQNRAGEITFECGSGLVNIYVGNEYYSVDFLENNYLENNDDGYYLGTLKLS